MSVTDTAKHLNEKEKESLDVAEGARETEWTQPSFVAELFMGRFRTSLISPIPCNPPRTRLSATSSWNAFRPSSRTT